MGLRDSFQGSGAGGTNFWGRDMDDDPPHGPIPGGVPTHDISADHWESTPEVIVREMGISTSGYNNAGSGF